MSRATSKTSLGLFSAAALVVANMVGSGVFTTSGYALADLGSPWLVLAAWVICGFIAICGALSYGALVRRWPESGGEYVLLARTLHPMAGFLAGWVSLIAGFTAPIAVAGALWVPYFLRSDFYVGVLDPSDGALIDNVLPGMSCYDDEIFGPVLSVMRVNGYEDGVATINASPFANGTAIFTRDGGAARQFQFDIEVGMVGINVPIPVPVSYYSFGGWKASLFGDTHMYGPEGINFYTRGKVVTSRWPDPSTSSINLGFPETR